MAKPIEVTDSEFDQEVLQAELPVMVDFWAAWCGPCKIIAPIVEELAEEYDGKVKFREARHGGELQYDGPATASAVFLNCLCSRAVSRSTRSWALSPRPT